MIDQTLFNLIRYFRWVKSRPNIRRNIVFTLFLILSIFLTYKTVNQINLNYEFELLVIQKEQEKEYYKNKKDEKVLEIEYLKSPYYTEFRQKRDNLILEDGEVVLYLNANSFNQQYNDYQENLPAATPDPEVSNLRKWWRFFTAKRPKS